MKNLTSTLLKKVIIIVFLLTQITACLDTARNRELKRKINSPEPAKEVQAQSTEELPEAYEINSHNRSGENIFLIKALFDAYVNNQYGYRRTEIIQVFILDKDRKTLIIKKPLQIRSDGFPPSERFVADKVLTGKYSKRNGGTIFETENIFYEFMVDKVRVYSGNANLYDNFVQTEQYTVKSSVKIDDYTYDELNVLLPGELFVTYHSIEDVNPY